MKSGGSGPVRQLGEKRAIPPGQECSNCGVRYRQDEEGLCRRCARAFGDPRTNVQREAAHQHQLAIDRGLAQLERRLPRPPGPIRTITVRGRTFDVMFDGT